SLTAADTIANPVTGGTNSVFTINEYTGNTFLSGSLAGFSGTINCLTGGGAAAVVIEAPGPMSIPAAATWNIGNSATVDFNAAGRDAAHVILNGAGSYGNYGALRLDSCTQAGNILLTATSDIGNAGTGTISTISGVISDGGGGYGINRIGYPPVTNFIVLSGQNTYSGPTTLVSNTLRVASAENPGVSGPLGASPTHNPGNIVFVGGALQYSSSNQFDYSGRFGSSGPFNIDVNGQSVTFAAALSGALLTLSDTAGGGALTLAGANTYPGSTTVRNGTLKISGSVAGNVTLFGGSLELDSASAIPSTGSLSLPASPASGQVNLNFSGTQPISVLFVGGVLQASGTWGAVGSGAANQSTVFTGTGILKVTGQSYYYWDASGTDAASMTNANGGGDGSWDSGTPSWWNTGNSDTTWPGEGIAFFGGTAGTVTLNNDEIVDNLTFTTSGYLINGSSTLTLGGGATGVSVPSGGIETIACNVAGSSGLIQSGAGTLVLNGINSYAGGTTVPAGGMLQITAPTGAGSGGVTLIGNGVLSLNSVAGTVANAVTGVSNSVINIQAAPAALTFLSGSLANFAGTINCLAGGPTISTVVEAAGPFNIPATATWNVASGATLDLNFSGHTDNATVVVNGPGGSGNYGALRLDNCIQAGNVVLAGAGNSNQIGNAGNGTVSTISGVITDNGLGHGFTRVGYPPFNNVLALTGQNIYTGATTLSSNTLRVGAAEVPGVSGPLGKSAASNPGSIIFVGGILQFSSSNQFDYSGRFSTAPGQQYRIDVNGQAVTFASPLTSPAGALTLTDSAGGGALNLSAVNSCNGGITVNSGALDVSATGSIAGNVFVNAGTLEMDNSSAMARTGSLSMQSGATVILNYSGTQTISGLLVNGAIQSPGVYGAGANNPGGFTGTGTLTVTGQPVVTISTTTVASDQLTICWTSVPGINYNVYTSTDLSSSTNWTLLNTSPIPATGGTTCYTLPGSVAGQPQLFVTVQE
ncbi:MAG TPA: autotransporter-associated beta strand repeat-containing protein, partial [Candidatus Saccharimonadales bacterium]|nr:autotransporter-associated beta strand repeat-containing protein [Candidatus Saccharimonadales bacterium]